MNVITAVFTRSARTSTTALYQYDYGQILKIEGIDLPQAYEVHFSADETRGNSVTQIGGPDGVSIPDALLLTEA